MFPVIAALTEPRTFIHNDCCINAIAMGRACVSFPVNGAVMLMANCRDDFHVARLLGQKRFSEPHQNIPTAMNHEAEWNHPGLKIISPFRRFWEESPESTKRSELPSENLRQTRRTIKSTMHYVSPLYCIAGTEHHSSTPSICVLTTAAESAGHHPGADWSADGK